MATQSYRHPSDQTVGINASSPTRAPGHAPEEPVKAGSENKTPSPTRPFDPLTRKDSAWGRATTEGSGNSPGANAYSGPSSMPPGTRADPPAISAQAPVDQVLEGLIRGGVKALDAGDDWQTRPVSNDQTVPTAHGLSKRGPADGSPGATIPEKIGAVDPSFDARRNAGLTRIKQS